jgi:hypothetical protein
MKQVDRFELSNYSTNAHGFCSARRAKPKRAIKAKGKQGQQSRFPGTESVQCSTIAFGSFVLTVFNIIESPSLKSHVNDLCIDLFGGHDI